MKLIGAFFSGTGRLTAVFIIRIIKDVQIRAITCKKLKTLIIMFRGK